MLNNADAACYACARENARLWGPSRRLARGDEGALTQQAWAALRKQFRSYFENSTA